MQVEAVNPKSTISDDTLHKALVRGIKIIPNDLTIHFAFDKYDLVLNEDLDKYFVLSNEYLVQNALAKLDITGHTDAVGNDEYNQALGFRRAQSVQRYFKSKGMLANRIIIDSKGEKKPLDDNNTVSGRAKNRRTEITIKK